MKRGTGKLLGLKDETGDIVGLPRRPNEILNAFHELAKSFLRGGLWQRTNYVHPPRVGEFFARSVECFNDAVRKQNQRISWLDVHGSRRKRSFRGNPERQTRRIPVARSRRLCAAGQENCGRRLRIPGDA